MAAEAPAGPAPRITTSCSAANSMLRPQQEKSMDRQDTLQDVRIRPQQFGVKDEAVIQPPANVVAGRAPALDRLVVAASGAEVARPARAAGRLLVEVAAIEPVGLPAPIHAG